MTERRYVPFIEQGTRDPGRGRWWIITPRRRRRKRGELDEADKRATLSGETRPPWEKSS